MRLNANGSIGSIGASSMNSVSHDDYEVGDEVVVDTGSTKQIVLIESKSQDIKRGRKGWDGEVLEVLHTEPGAYREEGGLMWGYTDQIEEVR